MPIHAMASVLTRLSIRPRGQSSMRLATMLAIGAVPVLSGCGSHGDSTEAAPSISSLTVDWNDGRILPGALSGDHAAFQDILGAVALSSGRVVIVDRGLGAITVVDPNVLGEPIVANTSDPSGRDNGMILAAGIRGDSVAVYDVLGSEVAFFDEQLNRGSALRMPRGALGLPLQVLGVFSDGSALASDVSPLSEAPLDTYVPDSLSLFAVSRDGSVRILPFRLPKWPARRIALGEARALVTPLWRRAATVVVRNDSVYVADGARPEIRVFTKNGRELTPIRWDAIPFQPTPEQRAHAVERRLARLPNAIQDTVRMLLQIWAPDLAPPTLDRFTADPAGNLWIREPHGADSSQWRLVSSTGRTIGTLRMPPGSRLLTATRDHLILAAASEDRERLERFRLVPARRIER